LWNVLDASALHLSHLRVDDRQSIHFQGFRLDRQVRAGAKVAGPESEPADALKRSPFG
jgi:hypothetical protein